ATSPSLLQDILDRLDLILVMSVNPGFGGQSFIESSLDKIAAIRQMTENHATKNHVIEISVDGGVNEANAPSIIGAGASVLVAGSAIFSTDDYRSAIANLRVS
ncbi:MAG: ribulose-phosphate 3-epimerase, partial [Pseudomonadota bacterium]